MCCPQWAALPSSISISKISHHRRVQQSQPKQPLIEILFPVDFISCERQNEPQCAFIHVLAYVGVHACVCAHVNATSQPWVLFLRSNPLCFWGQLHSLGPKANTSDQLALASQGSLVFSAGTGLTSVYHLTPRFFLKCKLRSSCLCSEHFTTSNPPTFGSAAS